MLIPGKVLYSNPSFSTLTLDIGPSTFKEFVVYEITPSEDVYSNFGEELADIKVNAVSYTHLTLPTTPYV